MRKPILLLLLLLSIYGAGQAQFFYKDIVTSKQIAAEMNAYRSKKVHHIKINSFEDSGEPSEGFFCEKKISKDFKTTELFTRSTISGPSLFKSTFDDKGNIIVTFDSSDISATRNYYY